MSELFNPYAVSVLGNPLPQKAPPQLRAEGRPMTRPQLDMARFVFGRFLEQARLSYVPNPTQHGFLPDGSRFMIIDVAGSTTMQVWPVGEDGMPYSREKVCSGFVILVPSGKYIVLDAVKEGAETQGGDVIPASQYGWKYVEINGRTYANLIKTPSAHGVLSPSIHGEPYFIDANVYGKNVVLNADRVLQGLDWGVLAYEGVERYYRPGVAPHAFILYVKNKNLYCRITELSGIPSFDEPALLSVDDESSEEILVCAGVKWSDPSLSFLGDRVAIGVEGTNGGVREEVVVYSRTGRDFTKTGGITIHDEVFTPSDKISLFESDGSAYNPRRYVYIDLELDPSNHHRGTASEWAPDPTSFIQVSIEESKFHRALANASAIREDFLNTPQFSRGGEFITYKVTEVAEYVMELESRLSHVSNGTLWNTPEERERNGFRVPPVSGGWEIDENGVKTTWGDTFPAGADAWVTNRSESLDSVETHSIKKVVELAEGEEFTLLESIAVAQYHWHNDLYINHYEYDVDFDKKRITHAIEIKVVDNDLLAYDRELNFMCVYEGEVTLDCSSTIISELAGDEYETWVQTAREDYVVPDISSIRLKKSRIVFMLGGAIVHTIPIPVKISDLYKNFYTRLGWKDGNQSLIKEEISLLPPKLDTAKKWVIRPAAVAPYKYVSEKPEVTCRYFKTPDAGGLWIHLHIDDTEHYFFVNKKCVVTDKNLFQDLGLPVEIEFNFGEVEVI